MASYSVGDCSRRGLSVRNEINIKLPSLSVNEGMARAAVAAFCVQADPSATELADIKCAVSEAVTNCIVHAYRDAIGDIQLRVRIYNEGVVKIEIKDRGCGMTAEQVANVTDPFFTTRKTRKVGLGLPFLKMEAELTGGSFSIESTVGVGTVATIRIPKGVKNEDHSR